MPRPTFRKVITSEEYLEEIHRENKQLINRYLKEKNRICSDATIVGYQSDLNIFFVWNLLYNNNKFFCDIKKREFADFFSYGVDELHWSGNRFSRIRAVLSGLSDMIEKFYDEEYPLFRNVILKVIETMPKNPVREKTVLREDQVNDLFDFILNVRKKPQEACLLALAVASGARASELLRFSITNIDKRNTAFDGLFLETLRPIKTKGRTKTGKPLIKYIIKDIFLPYYEMWLPERNRIMELHGQNHDALFIRQQDGRPIGIDGIRLWVEHWENHLEIPLYPHCFRHYMITYLSKLGLPSDFIIDITGWGNGGEGMYRIYNDLGAKDRKWNLESLKQAVNK